MTLRTLSFILAIIHCSVSKSNSQKRLVPLEFSSIDSETYSVIEGPEVTVFAENLEVHRDLLVFDIEVKNHSGKPVSFSTQKAYYYGSMDPFPKINEENWEFHFRNSSEHNYPNYARTRHFVEGYYKQKIRSKENTKKFLAVIGAGLMIYDAVRDGQDFRREPTRSRINRSISRDITTMASLTAIDIASGELTKTQIKSDEDLYYLTEEFLTQSKISNGESIRGKVYFSQRNYNEYYRLMIPVEGEWYVFDFRWPSPDEKRAINR